VIEVSNVIRAYPETSEGSSGVTAILLKSHWSDSSKVVLFVEGVSVTLLAKDLMAALKNAQNSSQF
jgi:hypothetical protein